MQYKLDFVKIQNCKVNFYYVHNSKIVLFQNFRGPVNYYLQFFADYKFY